MSSRLIVNSIRHTGASGDAVTLANDGTCTAKITNNLSNRNIIINGAMYIAQRGTSSTTNESLVVDRFENQFSGTDEAPTYAQVDVASGTTPYTLGFRKALKITNGNQTSGAGSSDMMAAVYNFESQDIANSGWNYTSSSSYITLSYWVKSSVAQNFYGRFQTHDGTSQNYPFETGSLSANTWTKITKTISGNSNLQFDNDVNLGMSLELSTFRGTDKTGSIALNAWNAYGGGTTRTPDQTSTWYTTNDATFELTGVQLEVGSTATDFEHRSYGDELTRCQRYFQKQFIFENTGISGNNYMFIKSFNYFGGEMRSTPSISGSRNTDGANSFYISNSGTTSNGVTLYDANKNYIAIYGGNGSTASIIRGIIDLNAEL